MAEDTGLEVTALDGDPGVYSARYAGPHRSDEDNITKLLPLLAQKEDRNAQFRTVLALWWQDVQYSVQVLKEDNLFKYLVIGFKKREKAVKVKEEMRKMGFSDAFVIAYRNGQRIKENFGQ